MPLLAWCSEMLGRTLSCLFKRTHFFACRDLPKSEDAILSAGGDEVTVSAATEGVHEGLGTGELLDFAAIAVDEADLGVTCTGGCSVAGSEVVDGGDFFVPSIDVFAAVAKSPIPNLDGVVCPRAAENAPICTPSNTEHMMGVAFKSFDDFTGG